MVGKKCGRRCRMRGGEEAGRTLCACCCGSRVESRAARRGVSRPGSIGGHCLAVSIGPRRRSSAPPSFTPRRINGCRCKTLVQSASHGSFPTALSHQHSHLNYLSREDFCPRSEVDSRRGRGASGCHTFPTSHGAAKGRSWFRAAEVDRTPAPGGGGAGWRAWSASGRRVRHRGTAVRPRSSQCQSIELRRPFHPRSGLADISCSDLSVSRTAL